MGIDRLFPPALCIFRGSLQYFVKGMYYMDTADTAAEYSERRPRGQAWRVCQSGSVTYADSRDAALKSHKAKLAALAEAESLLRAAAIASNSGK